MVDVVDFAVSRLAERCIEEFERYGQVPERWASDLPSEIDWWWRRISELAEDGRIRYWFNQEEKPFPWSWVESEGTLRLLDVGSGPRSLIGRKAAFPIALTSCDPLASAYNRIYDLLGIDAPRIDFGAAEILTSVFPDRRFDMVCAKNCLDHSFNVIEGITQMSKVLDDRGVLLLEHWKNEAEAQNYSGLHKWNMEIRDEALVVWNKESETVFDHAAHGFSMEHSLTEETKGTGRPHDFLRITFRR